MTLGYEYIPHIYIDMSIKFRIAALNINIFITTLIYGTNILTYLAMSDHELIE